MIRNVYDRLLRDAGAGGGGTGDGGGAGGAGGLGTGGAGTGGTGGAAPWYSSLPAELQTEASIRTVPDVTTLARNYINAQKLVGADKVVLPPKNATPQQLNEFFDRIGRPKTADSYTLPSDFKMADGLKIEEPVMKAIKEQFHTLGLTDKQGNELLKYYMAGVNTDYTKVMEAQKTAAVEATQKLQTEWGANYEANLDIAKAVVRKFGGEAFLDEITRSGIGNNTELIKLLHNAGKMMLEDNPLEHGKSLLLTNSTQAVEEIGKLKMDKEFQTAFGKSDAPGHKEAVAKWMELHRIAYPGKQEG